VLFRAFVFVAAANAALYRGSMLRLDYLFI